MKKATIIMMSLCALAACNQRGQGALDLTDLDPTTSPKEDFYQYATGGWQAKNPLKPATAPSTPSRKPPRRT